MAQFTDKQAHEIILSWCRSDQAQCSGARPVMRTHEEWCRVIDASCFDPPVMAEGPSWIEVLIGLIDKGHCIPMTVDDGIGLLEYVADLHGAEYRAKVEAAARQAQWELVALAEQVMAEARFAAPRRALRPRRSYRR